MTSVSSKQHVLLAGATGYIGREVLRQLLEQGYAVSALVRDGALLPAGVDVITVDFQQAEDMKKILTGKVFDSVISCVASKSGEPTDAWLVDYEFNAALLAAAEIADAKHFVLLSAICVQRPKLAFQHAKLAFESALRRSDMDYSIVRPTAFFRSLSGQIERVKSGKPFLLFGDGLQTACKPISAQDLAAFLIDCLSEPSKRNQVLPIGGPGEAITLKAQGEMLFELTGNTPKFRSVPVGLFSLVSAILSPFAKWSKWAAAKAEFARIGRYYATESMLLWDPERGEYSADATPATGSVTLRDHYEQVLREGMDGHEAGEQGLF